MGIPCVYIDDSLLSLEGDVPRLASGDSADVGDSTVVLALHQVSVETGRVHLLRVAVRLGHLPQLLAHLVEEPVHALLGIVQRAVGAVTE